jgi:hypothetical protein
MLLGGWLVPMQNRISICCLRLRRTPLRLLVAVKLGLKNIKAITRITYTKTNRRTIEQRSGIHAIEIQLSLLV